MKLLQQQMNEVREWARYRLEAFEGQDSSLQRAELAKTNRILNRLGIADIKREEVSW